MATFRATRYLTIALTILALPMPKLIRAEVTTAGAPTPSITDVELGRNGALRGRVIDAKGAPKAGAELTVWQGKKSLGKVKSNPKGEFAFSGLRAGVHQVTTEQGAYACRFWSMHTAPPSAKPSIMLIDDPNATTESVSEVMQAQYVEADPGPEYVENPGLMSGGNAGPSSRRLCVPRGPCGLCWHNPLLIGAIVATAIAVPVALNGNGDGGSGS